MKKHDEPRSDCAVSVHYIQCIHNSVHLQFISQSINQSINQSLFAAISKYSATVVNRQLWTGQWGQSTNQCTLESLKNFCAFVHRHKINKIELCPKGAHIVCWHQFHLSMSKEIEVLFNSHNQLWTRKIVSNSDQQFSSYSIGNFIVEKTTWPTITYTYYYSYVTPLSPPNHTVTQTIEYEVTDRRL